MKREKKKKEKEGGRFSISLRRASLKEKEDSGKLRLLSPQQRTEEKEKKKGKKRSNFPSAERGGGELQRKGKGKTAMFPVHRPPALPQNPKKKKKKK